tara:strand:+ start:251 stop:493 length:243 start_codon:yes stop_codon:yes gene_type:complete
MKTEILFFSAPWCGPCKQIKTMINESITNELNLKIIDITQDLEIAKQYQIMNVPTFIKVENNKEVSRKIGSITINDLKKL